MPEVDAADMIGAAEAAQILNISRPTLWRLSKSGRVPVLLFIPERRKDGTETERAIYSRARLTELRHEWDAAGWTASRIHIKRRLDKQRRDSEQ